MSQSYRPVLFKDIIPTSVYERIDKDLEDAFGYNTELGVRGRFSNLQFDISGFSLLYKNRMGTLVEQDQTGQAFTYKTNIGDSRTTGVEAFLQLKFRLLDQFYAGLFTSTSYMDARYLNGKVSTGTRNESIGGKHVESVPRWMSRNGLELLYHGFSATILYSYTAASFSDALNTVTPSANGARGLTPSYSVWDVNASFKTNTVLSFRAGVNNMLDKKYFTKRPTMYPGAGIWPSDGRNAYVTIAVVL